MLCIQSSLLQSIPHIHHGFFAPGDSGRLQNNLSFKRGDAQAVRDARQAACQQIDVPAEALTHVYQEHGVAIHVVDGQHRGAGALDGENHVGAGDGMITREAGIPLAVLVADCLPILIADRSGSMVGIAHAGWRGTLKAIASQLVQKMQETYQVQPSDLLAWIGPGISFDYFEVGEDVWAYFMDGWCHYPDCFDAKARCVDLKALNANQLIEAGLGEDQIEIDESCTMEDERFYSYRRQGEDCGHNMAVIMVGS